MQTWSFLGAARVLRASAWRGGGGEGGGEGGGGGRGEDDWAGTRGKGVRDGTGRGGRSSGEGWRSWTGPCSCPLDRSEVRTRPACLADLRQRRKQDRLVNFGTVTLMKYKDQDSETQAS